MELDQFRLILFFDKFEKPEIEVDYFLNKISGIYFTFFHLKGFIGINKGSNGFHLFGKEFGGN